MGFIAAYIPPDTSFIFAFAGLLFPYAVMANLFFVFLWMLLLRKLFLISLIGVLICWARLSNYIQFNKEDKSQTSNEYTLRLMSYNVQIFDLYNWKGGKMSKKGHDLLKFIEEESPDILCLQEYHSGKKDVVNISDSIQQQVKLKYKQIALVTLDGKKKPYGIATYSRWPIVKEEMIIFGDNPVNFCISSDIAIKGDTIRLLNVHLESIRLSKEDYLYVSEIIENTDNQELFSDNSRKIVSKFKHAFIKRSPQARELADFITLSPYPVIVCGDFNDTPSSYTYRQVSYNLLDAFKESGYGIGQTYSGVMPSFRIDYILHDKRFISSNFVTIKRLYSDHYPIAAELTLKQ